jgi:hypothetical protein
MPHFRLEEETVDLRNERVGREPLNVVVIALLVVALIVLTALMVHAHGNGSFGLERSALRAADAANPRPSQGGSLSLRKQRTPTI